MSASADQLRDQAREILSGRGYSETELPRPFEGPLDWLGDRLRPILEWLSDRFEDVAGVLPGGRAVLWALIGLAVIAVVFALARRTIRRREALARDERRGTGAVRAEDPRALEREADAAEHAGDWERAVRLRFRAGVLRLGERALLDNPGAATTGELAERLHSHAFEPLGRRHDEIAYGGRPAGQEDALAARAGWPVVLEEARPR